MTHKKGAKLEPPFRLEMDFSEALERFAATKPSEIEESIRRAKKKGSAPDDPPARPPRKVR